MMRAYDEVENLDAWVKGRFAPRQWQNEFRKYLASDDCKAFRSKCQDGDGPSLQECCKALTQCPPALSFESYVAPKKKTFAATLAAKLSYHRTHHAMVKSASSGETRLGAEPEQGQPSDVAADFSQSSAPTSTQPQAAADVPMPYTTAETCDAEPPLAAVDAPAADRTIAAPASSSHASAPPSKRVCVDSHWPAGNTQATYKDHEMAEGRLCGDAQGSTCGTAPAVAEHGDQPVNASDDPSAASMDVATPAKHPKRDDGEDRLGTPPAAVATAGPTPLGRQSLHWQRTPTCAVESEIYACVRGDFKSIRL